MSETKNHTYAKRWIDKWVEANHKRLVLEEQVEILTFYLELIKKGKDVNDFPLTFKEMQLMAKEALNEVKDKEKVSKTAIPDIAMAC